MNVLVYSDAESLGGAESTLGHMLAELDPRFDVHVVAVNAEVLDWLVAHRPGTKGTVVAALRERSDLAGMRAHRRFFKECQPDLIHFNLTMAPSCQWPIMVALTLRHPALIAVENSPMAPWTRTSFMLKALTSSRLQGHVAVGERSARIIESDCGLPVGCIETMYHGVPDVEVHPVARDTSPVVGTVARLDPVKGVDVVIEAIAQLDDEVRLVIIGEGPERANLEALAAERGCAERVEFRTVPWSQSVRDHLASFDVFTLGSRIEGLPVTIMEAMLSGVPVVATDVGSVREVVADRETGIVVPPESPDQLAEAIRQLLADPERRDNMGRAGRARAAEMFTTVATARRYEHLYAKATALPRPSWGQALRWIINSERRRGHDD